MLMPVVYALLQTIGIKAAAVFPVLHCMDFDGCLWFSFNSDDCNLCHLYHCVMLDRTADLIYELIIHVRILLTVLLYEAVAGYL